MRILIVDDSRAMRMIIIKTMRHAGFRDHDFKEAGDGEEALALIRADPPDLVMADWNMPKMSGINLLKALRASGCELPFGFVTSESTPEMRESSAHEGAQFLVAKPFNEDTFREILGPFIH